MKPFRRDAAKATGAPPSMGPDSNAKKIERLTLQEDGVLSNLLATPDLFPMLIDAEQGDLLFIRMSQQSFAQSAFLDRRAVRAAPGVVAVALDQVLGEIASAQPRTPLHFVLHGAFCGSTLLARYLESLQHAFVLREPQLLAQLAEMRERGSAIGLDSRKAWFAMSMALLARGYPSHEAVVIKAADRCNSMGHMLLDHDSRTKIIFLSSPLEIFLLQVLKIGHRRQWLREHMKVLRGSFAEVPFLRNLDLSALNDGECAAAMWLLNCYLCASLLARPDSKRVLVMSGDDLISQPRDGLLAAADFLGLIRNDADRSALEAVEPSSRHAKDARLAYDADARAAELREAQARYGDEVRAALSWAKRVGSDWLPDSPFPLG